MRHHRRPYPSTPKKNNRRITRRAITQRLRTHGTTNRILPLRRRKNQHYYRRMHQLYHPARKITRLPKSTRKTPRLPRSSMERKKKISLLTIIFKQRIYFTFYKQQKKFFSKTL